MADRRTLSDHSSHGPRHADVSGAIAESLVASAGDAIMAADAQGRITLWNDAAAELFGHAREDVLGRSLDVIIPEAMRGEHSAGMRRICDGSTPRLIGKPVELQALRADGSLFPVEMRICMWRGEEMAFGAVMRDVSERRRTESRLHGLAHFDQLTMLPNRTLFLQRLQEAIAAPGGASVAAVLVIDLDNFAEFNDAYGHALGDEMLCMVAVALKRFGSDGAAARIGPNQFALVLPGAEMVGASDVADRIAAAVREVGAAADVVLSASIGISIAPAHGTSAAKLVANADFALRRAKQDGGGRRQLFDPRQRASFRNRRNLEGELKRAWTEREFEVYYQPQVRLADRVIVGGEALLRWRHPERGVLTPGAFLHALDGWLAERVGDFVLEEACRQAASWRTASGRRLRIGVNLFERQFLRADQPRRVADALQASGLAPEDLELEITETVATGDDDATIRRVQRLRDLGVGIAFDDYGTGYASLGLLKRYPITRLKIDRSFVHDLSDDGEDVAIVDLILALGARFGLGVIAEGVEQPSQASRLLALGCGEAQGYLFGRPMPGAEFEALIAAESRLGALVA
jgi:diguanylate cyclase (GGDEF)-like protein/PAS domain S-box-containing protein